MATGNAGFGCEELRAVGIDAPELREAGATAAELKAAAYPLTTFATLCPCKELLDVDYTCEELRLVGFDAGDVLKAGASDRELRDGGYTARQARQADVSFAQLRAVNYTAEDFFGRVCFFTPQHACLFMCCAGLPLVTRFAQVHLHSQDVQARRLHSA